MDTCGSKNYGIIFHDFPEITGPRQYKGLVESRKVDGADVVSTARTPQETRSGPVEPAFNGMAWGACQNNATTIVTSADYIKPSFLSEEEKRSWYTGEILTLAMLLYNQRPS